MNYFCLIFNVVIWLVCFLYVSLKLRRICVTTAILMLYLIISILGVHLFFSPYALGFFIDLKIFPYIYLFCMIMMAIYPLYKVDRCNVCTIITPHRLLFNTVCICIVFLSLINVLSLIENIHQGIFYLFVDEDYGRLAYYETASNYTSASKSKGLGEYNYIGILSNVAKSISPLFFIYYLILKKRNIYILIGLSFSSLLSPLVGLSTGSRGALMMMAINVIFLFIFLKNMFDSFVYRKMKRFFLLFFVLLLVPFFVITISRNEGDFDRMLFSLERYSSESFLRFNNYCLDANGCRDADYVLPVVKELLGLNPARDYAARLSKYSYMNIDESVFYTFVGDFTLDFGPFSSVIIFFFLMIMFVNALSAKRKEIYFYQYILYYILLVSCLGYYQFPWGRIEGNLQLIVLLLLMFVFYMDSVRLRRNKKLTIENY